MKKGKANGGGLLVLVDVGNTNTVFGIYRGDELVESFRLSTDTERTADEYGALLLPLFTLQGIDPASAETVVISSVVPPLHLTLDRMARRYFGKKPLLIEPGVRTGMPIRYDNPGEVGADRIVNAVAARERYGSPVIVVDFGTATTFDVVNAAGEYVGGIITPGIGISAEALFAHASRLYRVDVRNPRSWWAATPRPPCRPASTTATSAWGTASWNPCWPRSPTAKGSAAPAARAPPSPP